jgi:SAM-dependent methyltransferase
MLDARAALLESGVYAPIADAVAAAAAGAVAGSRARPDGSPAPGVSIADLGCGTGYYAAAVVARVATARLLAADRSPDAVRLTLRALTAVVETTGVVLDLWRPLPLRDASADVLLDVFAPRNPPEYARVLRPDGALVVVVPTADHLSELRATAGMLDIPDGKAERVEEQFAPAGLDGSGRVRVEYVIEADASTRARIAGMGPSAHHREASAHDEASTHASDAATRPVTVSVDVLTFRKP